MKKLFLFALMAFAIGCSDKYDDSALRDDLNNLGNRVTKLEELCKQMNTNISSLQKIVEALEDNLTISKVEQISDGYIIHFSDNSTATIKNGKDSDVIPVIGVKQDTDGIYYWTLDGKWLTDGKGNKVKAQGTDGEKGDTGDKGETGDTGEKGDTGITPQLKIENEYWFVSYDNGKSWTQLDKATGEDGKDGTNGIFKSVTEDDDNVYFTLADDSVITIAKGDNSRFAIAFDMTDIAIFNGGESKTISYTITEATENTVVKAIAQDGWKVKVNVTSTSDGTITITAPNPITESEILVFANDGSYRTVMASLHCFEKLDIQTTDDILTVTEDGGLKEVKLLANLSYKIHIPDNAQSWLSVVKTRSVREDIVTFNITKNSGLPRFATVEFQDDNDNIIHTITIRQLGIIYIGVEGSLETVLSNYNYNNIESLKITGVLNAADFGYIRKISTLRSLDISGVAIVELPSAAFSESHNIENIILPNSLVKIGRKAFYNSSVKTVVVPRNVEEIEAYAFTGSSLESITFEKGSLLRKIGGEFIYNYNFGGSSRGAFAFCNLKSIEIPANVETIEIGAFYGCQSLTSVTFENGSKLNTIQGGFQEYLGNALYCVSLGVFAHCQALTYVEIPASVKTIAATAFDYCTSLKTIIFEEGSQLKVIGGGYPPKHGKACGAFALCYSLSSIKIPASVEIIETAAFYDCTSLTSVVFEENSQLKSIGKEYNNGKHRGAFSFCTNLHTFDASSCSYLSLIGTDTFYGDTKLSVIYIGAQTPPLCGLYAFDNVPSYLRLCVPAGCVDIYKTYSSWRYFNITELDE